MYSRRANKISISEHSEWLRSRIARNQLEPFWIVTLDGISTGYVRFERPVESKLEFEISIFIRSDFRNRGLGKEILNSSLRKMKEKFSGAEIFAYVHKENYASRGLFKSLNFELKGSMGRHDKLTLMV
jgi:L-amino acid N-acyltransferase YncA